MDAAGRRSGWAPADGPTGTKGKVDVHQVIDRPDGGEPLGLYDRGAESARQDLAKFSGGYVAVNVTPDYDQDGDRILMVDVVFDARCATLGLSQDVRADAASLAQDGGGW
jgi:hypothetical protein